MSKTKEQLKIFEFNENQLVESSNFGLKCRVAFQTNWFFNAKWAQHMLTFSYG